MSAITRLAKAAVLASALTLAAGDIPTADARPGGGFSTGSRGFRTFTPPPSTRTAPGTVSPFPRPAQSATAASRPAIGAPSRFGGGLMGGLMGGLLGAGLFGLLLGGGLFGGLGSLMGIIGFIAQIALIYWLARMAYGYFMGRASMAGAPPASTYRQASMADPVRSGSPAGSMAGGPAATGPTTPITIEAADYAGFERLLSVIQLSFGRGDVAALRTATTPEMLGVFTTQLEDNARKGVNNEVSEPKLVSGDLAEAWSEPSGDYATVAMRYSLMDATVDTASGRVVSGSRTAPQEITELWTFTRRRGGGASAWRLSAIQQVS